MLSLMHFPCWYGLVTFVFVVFHVGRGAIGQHLIPKKLGKPWQVAWMYYAHDALLHLCCTVFGFVCLLLAYRLAEPGNSSTELAGLVFLALVGLAGITGQLAVMLSLGKFPST